MLHNMIYTGFYEFPKWDIDITRGKHEPIISFEIWSKAQELIKAPLRQARSDFDLRGFVCCPSCNNALTAAYSTSRSGAKYGYYYCQQVSCPLRRKTVPKSILEGNFIDLLKSVEIGDPNFYKMAKMVWFDAVSEFKQSWVANKAMLSDRAVLIDRDIQNLINRVAKTGSDTIAETFENRINDLEKEKIIVLEKIKLGEDHDLTRAGKMFDQVIKDYGNLSNQWQNTDTQGKSMLFNRVFTGRLVWDHKTGYRTAPFSLMYQQKSTLSGAKFDMVDYTDQLSNIIEGLKARLYTSVDIQA